MSEAIYRQAIASIAAEAIDGEDVSSRIAGLAGAAGLSIETVAHEVDETIDLINN